MRRTEEGTVTTMTELLRRMADGGWSSRKVRSSLYRLRSTPSEIGVEEAFDDGKGHSDPITVITKKVDEQLFERALRERYVRGKPEWGYTSDWEFIITELGEEMYHQRVQFANKMLELLPSGEAMRACDLQLALRSYHLSEETVQDILDWLVCEEYLESHEHVGQRFYLLGVQRKVA